MSTITPLSFLDDGPSIASRLPQGLDTQQVAQWVSRGSFSDASEYTGSFVDDDEDMPLLDGGISTRQREEKKRERRRKESDERIWSDNARRAVSGDVRRHLDRIRDLRGKVQVRKVKGSGEMEKEKEKERVLVPVPRQWGTFVIKCTNGRVIVVDEEGEFDSGRQEVAGDGKQQEQRWVRAASTVEPSSPLPVAVSTSPPSLDQWAGASRSKERTKSAKRGREKNSWSNSQHSARALTRIHESTGENRFSSTEREAIGSPTGFMAAVADWKGNSQTSTEGDSRSSHSSINDDKGWVSPSRLPHPYTWANSYSNSQDRCIHGPRVVDDAELTDSEASLQQDGFDTTPSFSEATWDGFERRKTLSDVSIAGSNSIRSSLISRLTSHRDPAMSSTSRVEIRVDNQHGWECGSTGISNVRYANSLSGDNATHLSANWRDPSPCG